MKKRISLTISEPVLKAVDSLVDGVNVRSRSEAVESILDAYLKSYKVAVILGGGETDMLKMGGVFRPLIDICGKTLLERNLEHLKKYGFKKVFFIGKSELIGECFKVVGNGGRLGMEMIFIEENKTLGNAKTLELVEGFITAPFLVLPVDNYFDFDLDELFNRHRANRGIATLAVHASREDASDLGVVDMVGDVITAYYEKPDRPRTFLTSIFIGMYDPEIFEHIPKGDLSWVLQNDCFPKLILEGKLYGHIISGVVINLHERTDLLKVERMIG